MQRAAILSLFDDYQIRYPDEVAVVAKIRAFVETHADCFCRELKIGHITGSAWILNAAHTHVLLTHHKKLNIWVQLGGHADGESNVGLVAFKEAEEESLSLIHI